MNLNYIFSFDLSKESNYFNSFNLKYYNKFKYLHLHNSKLFNYENFDHIYYLNNNEDVLIDCYWNYWRNKKFEGKEKYLYEKSNDTSISNFNWKHYRDINGLPNEIKSFAFDHYLNFGIKENRKCKMYDTNDFDWKYYLNNNTDILRSMYFSKWSEQNYFNKEKYLLKKKKDAEISNFDWKKFEDCNLEIKDIVYNKNTALDHFNNHGKNEGRTYKIYNPHNKLYESYLDIIIKSIENNYENLLIYSDLFDIKELNIKSSKEILTSCYKFIEFPPIYLEKSEFCDVRNMLISKLPLNEIFPNVSNNLTLKEKIVKKKICVLIRGHVRNSFENNKLYEFIVDLSKIFDVKIVISCWNLFNTSRSWDYKEENNRHVKRSDFHDYLKDMSNLIEKVIISDSDCYDENLLGNVSNSKIKKSTWAHMWKGMLIGINNIDESKYDIILNLRCDLFSYYTDIKINFEKKLIIRDIISNISKNLKYGFLKLDKNNSFYCGIDNFFMSNCKDMENLIYDFNFNLESIIMNYPNVSYQEYLVKYYCDNVKNETALIITMVKDEVDIIETWLKYHGSIFGFKNIFVIDNYSFDGTYEILKLYEEKFHIGLIQLPYYKDKGKYISEIIKENEDYKFYFPIDIDEFLVLRDNNSISLELKFYLNNKISKKNINYKMNMIQCKPNFIYEIGPYEDLVTFGKYDKTFTKEPIDLDHGNHCPSIEYENSEILILHIPYRNISQIYKKTKNNLNGLNYKNLELNYLKEYIIKNPNCEGNQHVKNYILIMENCKNLHDFSFQNMEYSKKISTLNITKFTDYLKNLI